MKTFKNSTLFDLIETFKNSEIEEKFNEFKLTVEGFNNHNKRFSLETGDVIQFRNGYGIEMVSRILGFDKDGFAFLLWDCYWFAINLEERLISKVDYEILIKGG